MGRIGVALLACATLAACVSLPRTGPGLPADWPARRDFLQRVERFDLQGRVAVAAGDEGFSGALRWSVDTRGASRLTLDGPLGIGGLEIEQQHGSLAMRTAAGERLDGEAARNAIEQRLGFALPLGALRYWVLGVPQPDLPGSETPHEGAPWLDSLAQDGWQIAYAAYGAQGLPQRITLTRPGVRVRLLVSDWTLSGS